MLLVVVFFFFFFFFLYFFTQVISWWCRLTWSLATARDEWQLPQRAHNIKMTSYQRRCDVITSHRRWYDVILTMCACWGNVSIMRIHWLVEDFADAVHICDIIDWNFFENRRKCLANSSVLLSLCDMFQWPKHFTHVKKYFVLASSSDVFTCGVSGTQKLRKAEKGLHGCLMRANRIDG